jgi:hypothetical protein
MDSTFLDSNSSEEPKVKIADVFSLPNILYCYSFKWITITSNVNSTERMKDTQSNIALLSALMLTSWVSLLYQSYDFKSDLQNIIVGSCLGLAVVFHFLSMVNSVILNIMFVSIKLESTGQMLLNLIGFNAVVPMFMFYIGAIAGLFAMVVIIRINYLPITFYLCLSFVLFFGLFANAIYYQYNVVAFKLALDSENKKIYQEGEIELSKKNKHNN